MTLKQENLILALIGSDPKGFKAIEIHKILFMLGWFDSSLSIYEYIPFKKGCYSPSLSHDLRKLETRGYLRCDADSHGGSLWRLTERGEAQSFVARISRRKVVQFRHLYPLRGKELVVDVYKRYPYWAINSEIADLLLRDEPVAINNIVASRPKAKVSLASIGYEGRSIEDYFNCLIRAGIDFLCDVRRNPISRKYGFSRSTLSEICKGCGIEYRHYPQLGIPSCERRSLCSQTDYDLLFAKYEEEVIPKVKDELDGISEEIQNGRCVAVTCFEANPAQCHRTKVIEALTRILKISAIQL